MNEVHPLFRPIPEELVLAVKLFKHIFDVPVATTARARAARLLETTPSKRELVTDGVVVFYIPEPIGPAVVMPSLDYSALNCFVRQVKPCRCIPSGWRDRRGGAGGVTPRGLTGACAPPPDRCEEHQYENGGS